MKDKMTAEEFRKMIAGGDIKVGKKGKLKTKEEMPNVDMSKYDDYEFNPDGYIFIPGRVYSSKNGQQIRIKPATKSKWKVKTKTRGWIFVIPFIAKDDNSAGYMKKKTPVYKALKNKFDEMCKNQGYPLRVEVVLAMPDRGIFDYIGLLQLIQDVMVQAKWIPDDNVRYMIPTPPPKNKLAWFVDKKNPGVYIKVI